MITLLIMVPTVFFLLLQNLGSIRDFTNHFIRNLPRTRVNAKKDTTAKLSLSLCALLTLSTSVVLIPMILRPCLFRTITRLSATKVSNSR